MTRTVITLGGDGSLLEAADRIRLAPADGDLALVLPVGAALARSGVLLAVAHRIAGGRPFAVVSADPRARAIAASAHVRSYASLAALERHEVAPTEPDTLPGAAPRHVPVAGGAGLVRRAAIILSLTAAALLVLAVAVPSATLQVVAAAAPLTIPDFELRAGPGGEIAAQRLTESVALRLTGTATGTRTLETRAAGSVRFTNRTGEDIRLPRGTLVRAGAVRFVTTEDRSLPRSLAVPVLLSSLDIPVEALDAGPSGNVDAGKVVSSDPLRYTATNPQSIRGGESNTVPVVTQADYDGAERRIPAALEAAAQKQVSAWRSGGVRAGAQLVGGAIWSLDQQVPAGQIVGIEATTFDLLVAGTIVAFAMPNEQPRAAALARLRTAVEPGSDIDETGAGVDVLSAKVAENGVTFSVRATALQFRRANAVALRSLVAGRSPSEAEDQLRTRGVRLAELQRWPSWWPILPLLDSRITIVEGVAR